MKNKNAKLLRKVLGVTLALAMSVTSVTYVAPEKHVKAASTDAEMGTDHILDESDVKDENVLKYYTILANAQQFKSEMSAEYEDISTATAGEVLAKYGTNEKFTQPVYGSYLVEYEGEVDLAGIKVDKISGIGWARSAKKIDMSSVTGVTEIPDNEFASCKGATTIILPAGIVKIGASAFQYCTKLTSLIMGEGSGDYVDLQSVHSIGDSAFFGCSALKNVKFGTYDSENELEIGKSAFASCSSLKEIELPIKTAANLGNNAFENCVSLEKVGMHDSLKYISNAAFTGAGSEVLKGTLFYIIEDGEKEYSTLPSKITYIGEYSFKGAKTAYMDLSNCTDLTTIKKYGFASATFGFDADVENQLILPDSLTTVDEMSFSTSKLFYVSFPDQCTTIGYGAFSESAISKISLPQNLEVIPQRCFWGCDYLEGENIELRGASKLKTIEEQAFQKCKFLKTTEFLKGLTKLVEIKERAFADCYAIEKVGTTEANDIYGEKRVVVGLEQVILPNSVEVLGESVFANDYYLQEANLGTGVTDIPNGAFKNDISSKNGAHLTKIIVSNGLKSIGDEAFMNQFRLTTLGYTDGSETVVEEGTVQFPNGLNAIGNYAFFNCGADVSFSASSALVYVDPSNVSDTPKTGANEYLAYRVGDEEYHTVYIDSSDLIDPESSEFKQMTANEKMEKAIYLVAEKLYYAGKPMSIFDDEHPCAAKMYSLYPNGELYKNYLYNRGILNDASLKMSYFVTQPNTSGSGTAAYFVPSKELMGLESDKYITTKNLNVHLYFGMKKVTIPDSVKNDNLGTNAFENCVNLEQVSLSSNLTKIQASTFSGAGVMVANWASTAPEDAIYDYHGLQTINMPDGLIEIGNSAFYGCKNLNLKTSGGTSFGRKVKSIGDRAFSGCVSLTSISFPSSLTSIGEEAFANCAELRKLESDKHPYQEEGSDKKYIYYINLYNYGTKTKKTGLEEVNFTAASNLETIKKGAFKQTNIVNVNLTKSKCLNVPDSLFEQCSYLKTISFQDATESIGTNVLKDNVKLESVSLPALAILKDNFISGAWGEYSMDITTPTDNQTLIVPVNSYLRLPVNAVNAGNINGSVTITAIKDDKEIVLYDKDGAKTDTALGLVASVDVEKEGTYSFSLHGEAKFDEPILIKVATSVRYAYCEGTHYRISPETFTYKVNVADVPTTSVNVSAEDDANVKTNPSMYETSKGKVLYVPVTDNFKNKGINLSAVINPAETTENVQWISENELAVSVGNTVYEKGTGKSTATIYPVEIGNATVKVVSGLKSDAIDVYCVIPASKITCGGTGDILADVIQNNRETEPYEMKVGDTEKIKATLEYSKVYSEEQIALHGEKVVFISSDPEVLQVEEDGSIKALAEGDVSLTVKGQASGMKQTYYFRVSDDANYVPTSITVSDDGEGQVAVGKTIQLSAVVNPVGKASQSVTWSLDSSSTKYATLDENTGKLTGVSAGTATVYATSTVKSSVKSAAYKISVIAPSTEFNIFDSDVEIEVGRTYEISKTTDVNASKGYVILPSSTTDVITWTSSDKDVIAVDRVTAQAVTLKAVAPGSVVLTGVTSSGITKSIKVTAIQKVQSIKVDSDVALKIGENYQLTVTNVPENATEKVTYTFTSSNTSVATVDEKGTITALKEGSTLIRVSTNTGKNTSCNVKVTDGKIKVTGIKIDPKLSLEVGGKYQLVVTKVPENATEEVTYTYSSSSTSVATIDDKGMITALKEGTSSIRVNTNTGKSATCNLQVTDSSIKVTGIQVEENVSININGTYQLNPKRLPENATQAVIYTYTSENDKIATVSSTGLIKAVGVGSTRIVVKTDTGKSTTCTVTVKLPAKKLIVKSNRPNTKKMHMAKGQVTYLNVTMAPKNTTDQVTYTSSKKKVADVSQSGAITAKAKGKAKITVKTSSGKKFVITVFVSKKQVKAKKVKIKCKSKLKRKKTMQIKVTLKKAKSTDIISYSSSKPGVASVDSYGVVTGLKKGKVKITVTTSSGKKATKKIKIK